MSFEGYYQVVCGNNHYYEEDVYAFDGICPKCGSKTIDRKNMVDCTNDVSGYDATMLQGCDYQVTAYKSVIDHYESKLKEQSETIESMKGLIKELVEVCEFYMWQNKYHGYQSNKSGEWETYPAKIIEDNGDTARQVLSKNKELIEAIKGE